MLPRTLAEGRSGHSCESQGQEADCYHHKSGLMESGSITLDFPTILEDRSRAECVARRREPRPDTFKGHLQQDSGQNAEH